MVIIPRIFSAEVNKTADRDPRTHGVPDGPPAFPKIGCPDVNLTTFGGYIISPGYPNSYPNDTFKNYSIEVDPGFVVRLKFLDFEVEQNYLTLACFDMVKGIS